MAKKKAARAAGNKKAAKNGKTARGTARKAAATKGKKVTTAKKVKKAVKKTAAKTTPRAEAAKRAATRKAPRAAGRGGVSAPRPRRMPPPLTAPLEAEPMPMHDEPRMPEPGPAAFGDYDTHAVDLHEDDDDLGTHEDGEEEGGDEQPEPHRAAPPNVGDDAPDFELPDERGELHRLSDYRGQQVVLYFYPRDDTPGCTREACGFRDQLADFSDRNAVVLGVSADSVDSHRSFVQKYNLTFPLLADVDHRVAERYGVWVEKTNYGRTSMGIARTTFVIDENGRIARIFRNVRPEGHEHEVLAALRG